MAMNNEFLSEQPENRERRLSAAFQDFFQLRDSGQQVSLSEFVSRHADLQPELELQLKEAIDEDSRIEGQQLTPISLSEYRGGLEEIPSYRLLRPIGRGAYGTVWLIEHTNNKGQFRAVKIIPTSQLDCQTEIDGAREAYNRSQRDKTLGEWFVLPLDAPGEGNGFYYYLMELADSVSSEPSLSPDTYRAKTLRNLLDQPGPPEAKEILHVARDICVALEKLHATGCLHRDVKPANILSVRGRWKLADLGQLVRHDLSRGKCGTARYAADATVPVDSPLQDVLPLVTILYELLTKDHVFQHLEAFVHETDSEADEEITVALRRIIRKGLNKGFASAQGMLRAVEFALAIRPWKKYANYLKWGSVVALWMLLGGVLLLLGIYVREIQKDLENTKQDLSKAIETLGRLDAESKKMIVLQTDFGTKDHYMATLKGAIYKLYPAARIEVITSEIDDFDVFHAAWTLWRASKHFPEGTFFVVITNPGGITASPILITTKNGHIYVGHDNGCFDLVVQHYGYDSGFRLAGPKITPPEFRDLFGGADLFGPAAARIVGGDLRVEDCGTPLTGYAPRLPGLRWEVREDRILGTIMNIDRYGNVTTNISKADLESIGAHAGLQLNVDGGDVKIRMPLKTTYGHVSKGSDVAILFDNLLQFAVNEGNFATKYKLKRRRSITIAVAD